MVVTSSKISGFLLAGLVVLLIHQDAQAAALTQALSNKVQTTTNSLIQTNTRQVVSKVYKTTATAVSKQVSQVATSAATAATAAATQAVSNVVTTNVIDPALSQGQQAVGSALKISMVNPATGQMIQGLTQTEVQALIANSPEGTDFTIVDPETGEALDGLTSEEAQNLMETSFGASGASESLLTSAAGTSAVVGGAVQNISTDMPALQNAFAAGGLTSSSPLGGVASSSPNSSSPSNWRM